MNYNHPYSREARMYFYTTPIFPRVNGKVVEVPVEANTPLKKGDILFRFDAKPFEDEVANLKGQLKGLEVERDLSKEEYNRSLKLVKGNFESERAAAKWGAVYETALADIEAMQARLDKAQYELDEKVVVHAPGDGFVTQQRLRPGMTLIHQPQVVPGMIFVHAEEPELYAGFPQNGIQNIDVGNEAEITFDAIPGRAFKGKVTNILQVIAQGQVMPSRFLINFDTIAEQAQQGRVPVRIEVLDDLSEYKLPAGAKAEVAVYGDNWKAFSIVRRILLRMKSWQKFIFIGG
jgi:RND family efflux transporter MFP subunit